MGYRLAVVAVAVFAGINCAGAESKSAAQRSLNDLPWRFEQNRGQAPTGTAFVARGAQYEILIGEEGPVMKFNKGALGTVIRGGNRHAAISGEQPMAARANYFIGNKPEAWIRDVAGFGRVRYAEVYPSIDLIFYGNEHNLEFDFEVKPGGDPRQISLSWTGADKVRLDSAGNMLIATPGGEVRWAKPVIYQMKDSQRAEVAGGFRLHNNVAAFDVPAYDPAATLVIDPTVVFATYLGGAGNDSIHAVAIDGSGNILVAGVTSTTTLPSTGGVAQTGYSGSSSDTITGDAFVASLNPAGTSLNWLTYLGGSQDDLAYGIAVDSSGSVYITGMTNSTNFPVQNAAYATFLGQGGNTLNPLGDAFLTKLSSVGKLVYSTYFGGTADDWGMAVALDSSNNAYIAGFTLSTNLPVSASSYQKGYKGNGGNPAFCNGCGPVITSGDGFAAKFDSNGKFVWTTYLGGSNDDFVSAIAVDKTGVYLAGATNSNNFPVTTAAFQTTFGGASSNQVNPSLHAGDAFVAKLDLNGANLLYCTYLGGSGDDAAFGIAVDGNGAAYVTGSTLSSNFPTSPGAFQTALKGPATAPIQGNQFPTFAYGDAFAVKLNATGTALAYSTYFGGSGDEAGQAIAIDIAGNAYITGQTSSKDFPVTGNALQATYFGNGGENYAVGDAFLFQLNTTGTAELYGSYMGGNQDDAGAAIAIDGNGNAWIAGFTLSSNFPVTKGSLQTTYGGSNRLGIPYGDGFVAKISGLSAGTNPVINANGVVPVYSTSTNVQPGSWFSIYGNNLATATTVWTGNFPTQLGGTSVTVDGKNAYLWFVSAGQINAQAPDDATRGSVPVTVTNSLGSTTASVNLANSSPSFSLLGDGRHAVGIIIDTNGGGSQGGGTYDLLGPTSTGAGFRPAARGEPVALYGVGFGTTNPAVASGAAYACPPAGCATLVTLPQISVGGVAVNVAFGGIVGAGLYQFNFNIPTTVGSGDQTLVAIVNGVQTQPGIVIPIQ